MTDSHTPKPDPLKLPPLIVLPKTTMQRRRVRVTDDAPDAKEEAQATSAAPAQASAAPDSAPQTPPVADVAHKPVQQAASIAPIGDIAPIGGITPVAPIGGIAPVAPQTTFSRSNRLAALERENARRKQREEEEAKKAAQSPATGRRRSSGGMSDAERAATQSPIRRRGTGRVAPSPEDTSGYDAGYEGYDRHYYESTLHIRTPEEQRDLRHGVPSEYDLYTRDSGVGLDQSRHAECPFVPDAPGFVPHLNWTSLGGEECVAGNKPHVPATDRYVPPYKDPVLPKESPPSPENYMAIKMWLFSTLEPDEQEGVTPDDPIELLAMDMFMGRRPDVYQRYINQRHKEAAYEVR